MFLTTLPHERHCSLSPSHPDQHFIPRTFPHMGQGICIPVLLMQLHVSFDVFGHLATFGTLPPPPPPPPTQINILYPYLSTDRAGNLHPILLMQFHVSLDVFGHFSTLRTLFALVFSPLGRHLHDLFPPFCVPHLLFIVSLVLVFSFDVFHKSCSLQNQIINNVSRVLPNWIL